MSSSVETVEDSTALLDEPINSKLAINKFELKANKLSKIVRNIFDNPVYKTELHNILNKLNLNKEEITRQYVFYDLDIYAYGNEVYAPLEMRFVLYLHKLLVESWHSIGNQTVHEYVEIASPKSLVDLGFGIPGFYVKQALKNKKTLITLSDFCDSAFKFAESVLEQWSPHWKDTISFKKLNMDHGEFIGTYDTYLFLDSLEHVKNPAAYLEKYIKMSPPHAKFIFSLPIGPIVPVHYIHWDTAEEIVSWLENRGLIVKKQKTIPVNPEVDLFAEQLNFEYKAHISLCAKY